jgi:AICAR transformylase/IMP cyclohydrolase PurH
MAIDVNAGKEAVRTAIKAELNSAYGGGLALYNDFAAAMANSIAATVLQHIKDNAEVPNGTSGGDTLDVD